MCVHGRPCKRTRSMVSTQIFCMALNKPVGIFSKQIYFTSIYQIIISCWHINISLQWRHNGRDCVSNHQPHDCLLNHLFRRRSKKTSKLRVSALCAGNSPVTGEFPAQMVSNAENVSIWWRHHIMKCAGLLPDRIELFEEKQEKRCSKLIIS